MTLKTRLGKLEEPATEKWRRAWDSYFDALGPHLNPLEDPLHNVCDAGEKLGILKTVPECRAALDAFSERLDIPPWATSWGWDDEAELDLDKPNLQLWPHTVLSAPPPEPVGLWERVAPYLKSPDTVERWCAVIVHFTLANARGHREYLTQMEKRATKSA